MKHLLSILLISSICLTQEMEVDGDLKVTGNIQNQMIDSLLQVIQDLQSQLSALQGGNRLETRIFELPVDLSYEEQIPFNIDEITGFELEYPIVYLKSIDNLVQTEGTNGNYTGIEIINQDQLHISLGGVYSTGMLGGQVSISLRDNDNYLYARWGGVSGTLKLAITALFPPDSDVQLRKPGLQSKDKETVK